MFQKKIFKNQLAVKICLTNYPFLVTICSTVKYFISSTLNFLKIPECYVTSTNIEHLKNKFRNFQKKCSHLHY